MARKQMTRKQKKPSKQNKTKNVRKVKATTNKNKKKNNKKKIRTRRRTKKGGNKNCNYVPTFFLPKGGMYNVKSNTNGLGKGYYYGYNQCLAPGYPISTVGLTEAQKQKGGREEKRLLITQKSHALTHDQRFTTNERGHVREILKIKFLSEREEERERERVEILIKN